MGKRRMTASEALFGFGGWLTSLERKVGPFSSRHNAGGMAELISEFIRVNKLGKPRNKVWPDNLTHPSVKFGMNHRRH